MMHSRPWHVLPLFLLFSSTSLAQESYDWVEDDSPAQYNCAGVVDLGGEGASAKIVLDYRSKDDHLALAFAGRELKAVRVSGGKVTPLWPSKALPAARAHSFTIKRRADRLAVIVGDELQGQATGLATPRGRLGTSTANGAELRDVSVQETQPVYFTDDFMRGDDNAGAWEALSGKWRTKSIDATQVDANRSANPFSYAGVAKDRALATTGHWFWDSYLYRVAVRPEEPGAVGIVVFCRDAENYVALRWWSHGTENEDRARQLVSVRDGEEQILAAAPGGYQPGQWYRLEVKATDTRVAAFLDGDEILTAESPPFCGGKIGLYAEQCESVAFDDVLCTHWAGPADDPSPRIEAPRITPQFAREDTMQAWANPDYDWERGDDNWWWHRGEFWGDASLAADLPAPEGEAATASLTIHAQKEKLGTGYTLATESAADGSTIAYRLTRQGKELGRGNLPAGDWPVAAEIRRNGHSVLVEIGGERVLAVDDPQPLSGTGSALKTSGRRIPTDNIYATGTNYLDDTFTSAPVNWWQGKGLWQVTNRWHCSPQWSWMAGWKSLAPVLWTKRGIGGDFIVEAYLCNKMEQMGPNPYTHPGDLNLTVCGDGRDLGSGYSCVYAGWNNSASAIFRQGEECVPRREDTRLGGPGGHRSFHRKWFNVRLERRGNELRHFVDDELISKFDDPNPLPSGRVALWTIGNDAYTNGLVVARVRIWYERSAEAQALPFARVSAGDEQDPWEAQLDPVTADSLRHDFETGTNNWSGFRRVEGALVSLDSTTAASGKQSLRIENAGSGGDFTVWAGVGSFDAKKLGKLRFAYKLTPEAKINLYCRMGNRYYAVEFTGGPQPAGTCKSIGKIDDVVADGEWHTAEFDLGAALAKMLPEREEIQVDRLCFSAPKDTYYRAGIGGNGWGTVWHLDDFQLSR